MSNLIYNLINSIFSWERGRLSKKRREPKDRKDRSWIADVLLFFPELIVFLIRGLIRGLMSLFKWYT